MNFKTKVIKWDPPKIEIPKSIPNPLKNLEETTKNAIDNINNQIKEGKNLDIKNVDNVLKVIQDQVPPEVTETGKQFVKKLDEVKDAIKELEELTPAKLKEKILKEAEGLCEKYLDDKLAIIREIDLEGVPIVDLDFDGTSITIDIKIYITLKSDKADYTSKWGVLLETNLKQKFNDPVPKITLTLKLNEQWANGQLEDIKNKVEEKKDQLIAGLIESILQDYCPPLRAINETIKIFG